MLSGVVGEHFIHCLFSEFVRGKLFLQRLFEHSITGGRLIGPISFWQIWPPSSYLRFHRWWKCCIRQSFNLSIQLINHFLHLLHFFRIFDFSRINQFLILHFCFYHLGFNRIINIYFINPWLRYLVWTSQKVSLLLLIV